MTWVFFDFAFDYLQLLILQLSSQINDRTEFQRQKITIQDLKFRNEELLAMVDESERRTSKYMREIQQSNVSLMTESTKVYMCIVLR